MGCGVYWGQVHEVEHAMVVMERAGIDPGSEAMVAMRGRMAGLMAEIGRKFPRVPVVITHQEVLGRLQTLGLVYAGASPGFTIEELKDAVVKVWHDPEEGWMSEARFKPGSPPIYKSLSDEDAATFIKGEESGAMIAKVFTPDPYIGE